ncbi:MAG: hypothetical protein J7604_07005 [Sporocytophaga sp.]|uniref:hypothetical protein n=1 Tax=Sporocytophaga sp. TaxID=2231183 RepID=UPI001B0D8FB1|nr:hypothetical protein [Sporocytophaga sp.]MBO9699941.1 hypothetical protein [Sporocytophaga sp.]
MQASLFTQIGFYQKHFLLNLTEKIEKDKTFSDLLFHFDTCKKVMDTYEDRNSMFLNTSRENFLKAYTTLEAIDKRKNKIDSAEIRNVIRDSISAISGFANELV